MTESQTGKYRVGMIGIGRKGAQHARAYRINPLTQIVAAADTDEENLEIFCRRFNVPGYTDHKEMLAKESIDIASPILPVRPNPQVVIDCAEANVKAIMCEKPIAASLVEADRMVEACRSRGIKFGAGDLNRNLPAYWKAKEIIDSGEIGEVQSISFYGGSGGELSGGCQQFSLMRMFAADADVAWCIGWVADDPMKDHDQGGAGYFRFVNGIEAFLHRATDARGSGFEVLCSGGVFRSTGDVLHMWKAPDGAAPTWENLEEIEGLFPKTSVMARTSAEYEPDGWKWPGDRNLASVNSIVDALENDAEPTGSGDNGRKVLEMAIGLRESHRRGHVPIRFPLEDRSLSLIPHSSRMEYKKPQIGREAYMAQIAAQVRDRAV